MVKVEMCKGPECSQRGRRGSGLCDSHAAQVRQGRPLTALKQRRTSFEVCARDDQGRKRCPSCDQWKDPAEFREITGTSDGLLSRCNRCAYLTRYNLTQPSYDAILQAQGGKCAGCGCDPDCVFDIDHDHACCDVSAASCGLCIRGLLCGRCNRILGMAEDCREVLLGLVAYLDQVR